MDIDSRLNQIEKKLEVLERANRQILESLSKLSDNTKDAYSDLKILLGEDEPKSAQSVLLHEQEVKGLKSNKLPPLPKIETEIEELEGIGDKSQELDPANYEVDFSSTGDEESFELGGEVDLKSIIDETIEEDEKEVKEGDEIIAGLANKLHSLD